MLTIGFPRMHKELNEKRDFLPNFFKGLIKENAEIYLEKNYGIDLGFTEEDYLAANPSINFVSFHQCYEKDIVVVLRSPEMKEIGWMKPGSILMSMLHYETRFMRRLLLKERNIYGISLDSLKNDMDERIVVNYEATAGNGINVAFRELSKSLDNYYHKDRGVIHVSIIGLGMVGYKAAQAARIYGSDEHNNIMQQIGAKGVLIKMIPKNITCDPHEMRKILCETDILVDASSREDVEKYIIGNSFLGNLKPSSVILDLTADPYLTDVSPMQVKAIEGIPTGTLDKYVFYSDDPVYDTLPEGIHTDNRRVVVSCNAWPGVRPLECMERYGKQISPILKRVINSNIKTFSLEDDDYYNRAIYRASLDFFENSIRGVDENVYNLSKNIN